MKRERITLMESNEVDLVGVLTWPEREDPPVVVICHGLGSSKDGATAVAFEKALYEKNLASFRFDFFGHGESGGKFRDLTVSEAVKNIARCEAYLRKRGFVHRGLEGASFGGLASLIYSAKHKELFALGLKSPVVHYQELYDMLKGDEKEEWKEKGYRLWHRDEGEPLKLGYGFYEDARQYDGYRLARHITIPTAIVHGDLDDVVPVTQSQKLAENLDGPHQLEILSGVDHYFEGPGERGQVVAILTDFLWKQSPKD